MESEQDESRRIKSQFKYGGFSGYQQELAMGTAGQRDAIKFQKSIYLYSAQNEWRLIILFPIY
ncbi:hypothetical protein F4W66_09895 [Escherichia coli]|nr:hypothetical protein F4W66_09895 [Escherichia coli]